MKKLSYLLLAVMTLSFAACEEVAKEIDNLIGITPEKLAGTWYTDCNMSVYSDLQADNYYQTITFTADGKFTSETNYNKEDGTYSIDDKKITMTVAHAWSKEYGETEWSRLPENEFDILPHTIKAELLEKGNVIILQEIADHSDDEYKQMENMEFCTMLFKKGYTDAGDVKSLDGFWVWKSFSIDGTARIAVKFSGNNFEMIIPVWNERFSGTFEYKGGTVKATIDRSSFKVRNVDWEKNPDFETDALSTIDLFWETPVENDSWHSEPSFGWEFAFPFIADGKDAYGCIANMAAIYHKQ